MKYAVILGNVGSCSDRYMTGGYSEPFTVEQLFERHLLHRQMELRALLRERAGQVPLRHDRIVPQGLDRRTDNAVLVGLPELRRRFGMGGRQIAQGILRRRAALGVLVHLVIAARHVLIFFLDMIQVQR